jgi:hypothetical protein
MNTEIHSARKRVLLHKSESQMYNLYHGGRSWTIKFNIDKAYWYRQWTRYSASTIPSSHHNTSPTFRLNSILPSLLRLLIDPIPINFFIRNTILSLLAIIMEIKYNSEIAMLCTYVSVCPMFKYLNHWLTLITLRISSIQYDARDFVYSNILHQVTTTQGACQLVECEGQKRLLV